MGSKKIEKKEVKNNNNKLKTDKEIDEKEKQVFKRILVKFRQY
jgi:hypothetical protein